MMIRKPIRKHQQPRVLLEQPKIEMQLLVFIKNHFQMNDYFQRIRFISKSDQGNNKNNNFSQYIVLCGGWVVV